MKEHDEPADSRFVWPGCRMQKAASVGSDIDLHVGGTPAVIPGNRAPLVYVVDDDEAFRDSLQWLLESAGYGAVTYPTAESFLVEYEPGAAVCLVLDVRLPGMSGLDLQQELNRRGESLPVIFISAHGGVPATVEAMKQGAWHFLEKPFQASQLLSLMEQVAARHTRFKPQNGAQ